MSNTYKVVKFICNNKYCMLLYNVPSSQKNLKYHYSCPMCKSKAVRLVDTNVFQIHPKKRRF